LDAVRERIAAAARRAGRDPGGVTLIGVIKTVPAPLVQQSISAGLADLGENRVQEAQHAIEAIGRTSARWHMIGHLQRNKAARALELFDRIHGVDDAGLAEVLSLRAEAAGLRMSVLVQVNLENEPSKSGVPPVAVPGLVERVAGLPGLALDGLMSIGPPVETAEQARRHFGRVRALRDATERETGVKLPELSMGMSGDFEVAIEEGSTMVRVGTAIFGARGA